MKLPQPLVQKALKSKPVRAVRKKLHKLAAKEYNRILKSTHTDDLMAVEISKEFGIRRYKKTGNEKSILIGMNHFLHQRAKENTIKNIETNLKKKFSQGLLILAAGSKAKEMYNAKTKSSH